jgi:glutamate--cysteine ligase
MAIGAELELIPFDADTHRPVLIRGGSLTVLQQMGWRAGWTEIPAGDDPLSWILPTGGRISFEPGGQIEVSSAPSDSASTLIRDLQCTAQLLAGAFASKGISLDAIGVDPYNDIADVPLQLHRPRYARMTDYFNSIGPSGIRMMRQTASLQINVEAGPNPHERWSLLNAIAPYVTAIFANSPHYAGRPSGHKSYRAHLWRMLDKSRTGLPVDTANPEGRYFDFALGAGAMMRTDIDAYDSFDAWIRDGNPTIEDWELHLSTLFPEVRPRRYFELRSADAIAPEWLAAPIAFVAGLTYDDGAAQSANAVLAGEITPSLDIAGKEGLANERIRDTAIRLIDIALAGAQALTPDYIAASDIEVAEEFFEKYTRQGRSPGDDWS